MREETNRRKLKRIFLVTGLALFILIAVNYLHLNNTLGTALRQTLRTFDMVEVTYPSTSTEIVYLNITFIINNPTDFPMTIESINIRFEVGSIEIGGMNIAPSQDIPAGEYTHFQFTYAVSNADVLITLQKESYGLRMDGSISGSTRFLFVQTSATRTYGSYKTVAGIS